MISIIEKPYSIEKQSKHVPKTPEDIRRYFKVRRRANTRHRLLPKTGIYCAIYYETFLLVIMTRETYIKNS